MNPIRLKKEIKNTQPIKSVFLPTGKKWMSLESENLKVWESGKDMLLFKRIVGLINKAQKLICLQSFLIQDTEIIDSLVSASKRGVKVYVMDSAEARLNDKGFEEDEHYSVTEYKEMINTKFRFCIVHRQANNFHAKFIIIDPTGISPKGVLFTGNFNKKPFEENPELGIELSKSQVKELFQVFVYHFWEYAQHEQIASEEFEKLQSANRFKKPVLKEILVTSPDNELSNLKSTLISHIEKAKQSIFFSTFGFDIKNDVSKAILNKIEEGLSVVIFCRPREKAINNNIDLLASKGAKVYCHPLIHAKSIVVDTSWGAIFSANFEKNSMDESFEAGVELNTTQKDDLLSIYQNWENTFPYTFQQQILIKELPHSYCQLKNGKLNPFVALPEEIKTGPKKKVDTLNELIAFIEKEDKLAYSNAKKIIQTKTIGFKTFNKVSFIKKKSIAEGVDLVEYKEIRKKKKKEETITHEVLLFDNSITDENLENVVNELKHQELDNYKVYMN